MKRISILTLACLFVLTAATADAQNRRRTTRGGRTSSTKNQPTADTAPNRTAAARVAEQIKSLGRFLYLYGPISKELAASETGAANQSAAASETMQRNRAKLRDVFRDYRTQMDELETVFSSTSELRPYYTKLLGVAARAAQAEESVGSGRYNDAGNSLLEVMNRLTDVLLDMP